MLTERPLTESVMAAGCQISEALVKKLATLWAAHSFRDLVLPSGRSDRCLIFVLDRHLNCRLYALLASVAIHDIRFEK